MERCIINASGIAPRFMPDMAWMEDDPATNLVWLSNDVRMCRRGFLALANGTESLTAGGDVPMEAPPTPAATFLRTLLDIGAGAETITGFSISYGEPAEGAPMEIYSLRV
jgi:hypothetical protein